MATLSVPLRSVELFRSTAPVLSVPEALVWTKPTELRPPKVIAPDEVKPVAPEMTPVLEMFMLLETILIVPVALPMVLLVPAVVLMLVLVMPPWKVLRPPIVWAAAVTAPPLVPSAMVRLMVLPDILRPFALVPLIAPVVVTPLPAPSMFAGLQAVPVHMKPCVLPTGIDTPYMVKALVAPALVT